MEVHHHPHVEKKSLKEYILEGLMIFIAVTMGFIAENIREKILEHEIVKTNIEIIVDNLKADTATLSKVIIGINTRVKILDSIIEFQNKKFGDSVYFQKYTTLFLKSTREHLFLTNNEAYQQMKSSGNLRLVHSKMVLDSLFGYNAASTIIYYNGNIISTNSSQYIEDIGEFVNFPNINKTYQNINYEGNAKEILRFFNHCYALIVRSNNNLPLLSNQKRRAANLIKLLQKEYDIKE